MIIMTRLSLSIHQIKDWNPCCSQSFYHACQRVYLYLSIKSRIETLDVDWTKTNELWFISIYPSNQGLKLYLQAVCLQDVPMFISIYPSNQGLKPVTGLPSCWSIALFISIYPSNQGLKQQFANSILIILLFISIYPSNQGLKHNQIC